MISLSKKRFAILLAVMVIQPFLGMATAAQWNAVFQQGTLLTAAVTRSCDARMLDVALLAIETGERSPEKLVGARSAAEVVEWKTKALGDRDATFKQLAEENTSMSGFGIAVTTAQFLIAVLTFGALISRTTVAELRKK